MAKARPARQTFKLQSTVHSIDVAANGDIYVFGNSGYAIHHWDTAKSEVLRGEEDASPAKHGRLLGDQLLVAVSFNFKKQRDFAVIAERATGKLVAKLDTKAGMGTPREVAASDDGQHVAVSFGYDGARCGIEVFTVAGKNVRSVTLKSPADGIIFTADSSALLYFSDEQLHRLPLDGKKATSKKCAVTCWGRDPGVWRRDGMLLVQWAGYGHRHPAYLVEEASAKVLLAVPEAECTSFGPSPGTIVTSTEADVQVLDFKGKKLGAFKRDRKTRFEAAGWNAHGFWFGGTAGGSHLEVFDFNQLKEVAGSSPSPDKKRAPPKAPVVIAPEGADADRGEKLRSAIWKNPADRDALRVYADWLIEQGAQTQGEYIQLSLLDSPTDEQSKKANTLREKHRGQWLGAARPFVRSWSDDHDTPGFVSRAWCEAPKFIEGFEALLKLGPRLTISVTSMRQKRRDTEKRMAALQLGRVYALDLGSNAIDDTTLETLAPAMQGLTSLRLDQGVFTPKGLEALGKSVDTLTHLSIQPKLGSGAEVADGYLAAIAATGFKSLEQLDVRAMWSVAAPSSAALKAFKKQLPKVKVDVGE